MDGRWLVEDGEIELEQEEEDNMNSVGNPQLYCGRLTAMLFHHSQFTYFWALVLLNNSRFYCPHLFLSPHFNFNFKLLWSLNVVFLIL